MGDPLSVAGTVAGLVSLAIQLSQVSYQYVSDVKGSSKAWSSYIQELSALTSILLRLQTAGEAQEQDPVHEIIGPNGLKDAVSDCIRDLRQLKAKLEGKLAKEGVIGKLNMLAWPFSETDTQKKVDMLHRYHGIFSSALMADNFTVSIASYRELRGQRQENEFKQVLDWFRPLSRPQQAGSISEQQCPGTGSTFLELKEYLNWRDGLETCLWVTGQPGAGKTMLSTIILDDIHASTPKDAIVSYHFFRADNDEDSLQDFLRHLVFQGLNQCRDMIPEAAEMHRIHAASSADPLPKDLVHLLTAIYKRFSVVYMVLDGLDECHYLPKLARQLSTLRAAGIKILLTSRSIPDVRKHLEGWHQMDVRPDRCDISLYVDWRLQEDAEVEYDGLEDKLKEDIVLRLFEHADGSFLLVRLLMDNISSFTTIKKIRRFLEALPSDHQEAYQRTFDRIMKQNAGRRELALKALNWVSNTKRVLTMAELQYAMAVENTDDAVSEEDLESPKSILSSCLGIIRLSKTDQNVEFIHSSARSFILENRAKVDPDADKTILESCLAYLSNSEVASGPSTSFDRFARRLRSNPFLEYAARFFGYHARSVEERCLPELRRFLENKGLREGTWQVLHFGYGLDHTLAQDVFDGLPSRASVLHVASYWGFPRLLASVLEESKCSASGLTRIINAEDSHGWTPLHWASSMGQVDSAKILLSSGAAVDPLDSAGWTPLFWAAIKDHHDVASLLVSHGANVHQLDPNEMTPLHWSVAAGQAATTRLLLNFVEKALASESMRLETLRQVEGGDSLSISQAKCMVAPFRTSKSLVQLSAESLDAAGFSDLLQRAERRAESVGSRHRDLPGLDYGLDALFRNLWRGRSKVDLKFWLGKRYKDPLRASRVKLLECAIQGQHVSLVKALLDLDKELAQDLNRETLGFNGGYSLHEACAIRNPEIAAALIAKGADVNKPGSDGWTPLHRACRQGSFGVVEALLCSGSVDIAAKDGQGLSSLMTLLRLGGWRGQDHVGENLAILQALIAHGASLFEVDEKANTTANIAIGLWDPEVLQLLVDSGVTLGKTQPGGMTPLHFAACAPIDHVLKWVKDGCLETTRYVIPAPAIEKTLDLVFSLSDATDMTLTCRISSGTNKWIDDSSSSSSHDDRSSDDYEETALALAIASENWAVARRLHGLGAAFKTSRPLEPLLIEATRAGMPELVRLLINNGAVADPPPPTPAEDTSTLHEAPEVPICVAVRAAEGHRPIRHGRDTWFYSAPPNHLATCDYHSVIQVLISAGVDINRVDRNGVSVLEDAITRGVAPGILQTLLEAGADPYQPARNGLDYFQVALLHRSPDILSCLWEYSRTHPAPPDHWLHHADHAPTVNQDDADTLTHRFVVALSEGCAVDARDTNGHTLLFNAAWVGECALARELVAQGADVNDADPWGWTPLHAAVKQSDAEITKFLLEAGADINGRVTSETPWPTWLAFQPPQQNMGPSFKAIHLALLRNYGQKVSPAVVRILLEHGADPSETATRIYYPDRAVAKTPIEILFEHYKPFKPLKKHQSQIEDLIEIAEMLVDGGCEVGDVALGLSVEHVTRFEGHEELWEKLLAGMQAAKAKARAEKADGTDE